MKTIILFIATFISISGLSQTNVPYFQQNDISEISTLLFKQPSISSNDPNDCKFSVTEYYYDSIEN